MEGSYFSSLTPAMQSMVKARTQLTLDEPFFGQIALKLQLIETSKEKTAAVNGTHLWFNPEFVLDMSSSMRKGLLAHEIMHLVLLHHVRRGNRNHDKWNVAGDYSINQILTDCKFTLPKNPLLNPAYKDMTTDHIYNLLQDGNGDGGDGNKGEGGGGWGEVRDAENPDGSKADPHQAEQEWKVIMAQAATAAKMRGHMPAHLAELVEDITEPKVDWKMKLRDFVTKVAYDKHNWLRPDRRYLNPVELDDDGIPTSANEGGIYLPSRYNHRIGRIAVVIDTSGSIGQLELQTFIGEINAIFEDTDPETIEIIQCDAAIHETKCYDQNTLPIVISKFQVKGRGGTSFRPPFDYYKNGNMEEPIECLIYLTDMYGDFPNYVPEYPVLWISTTEISEAPFGEVVQIIVEQEQ